MTILARFFKDGSETTGEGNGRAHRRGGEDPKRLASESERPNSRRVGCGMGLETGEDGGEAR